MVCGICKKPGHNSRTCAVATATSNYSLKASSSSAFTKISPTPQKTITCGNCGRSGHNIRTCEKLPVAKTVTCGNCGKPGHNSRTCDVSVTPGGMATKKSVMPVKTITRGFSSIAGHDDRKSNTLEVNSSGDFAVRKIQHELADKRKSRDKSKKDCELCGEEGHNEQSCIFGEKDNWDQFLDKLGAHFEQAVNQKARSSHPQPKAKKDAKLQPKTKVKEITWLTEEAYARFLEGHTENDGKGYVYIYKLKNPEWEDEINLYKIGITKNVPERRVHRQELANREEYVIVSSYETPWRYVTDTVIKRQLEKYNTPRDVQDGGTEWHTGSLIMFQDTIKKVIREVNHASFE